MKTLRIVYRQIPGRGISKYYCLENETYADIYELLNLKFDMVSDLAPNFDDGTDTFYYDVNNLHRILKGFLFYHVSFSITY